MKISIIGSGFAGLSSALFLCRHKLNTITLYDKFDKVQTVGAGILIQPSSMEILKKLDLYDQLLKNGEKVYYLEGINHRGRQVFLTSYNDYAPESFGIGIHRSVLFNSLYDKCQMQSNIKFKLNQEITSLADIRDTSDLLIVANGSHSNLREQVPIKQSYQLYPYGCLWTTIQEDDIAQNQLCQYLKYSQEMFGILPSGINDDRKRIVSVFWSLPIRLKNIHSMENILEAMKFYLNPEKNYFLEKLKQANYSFAISADVYMQQYHHENIIFLGDAAHGMSPQLGQGANMAFIDSYFLDKVLTDNNYNIELALKNYTQLRKKHLKFYSQASKFLTPLYQSDQEFYGRFRDLLFTISKQMKFSRKISSQILCGKRTSWIRNKEIEY
jgi:2-polyprenyl-6-methoxyphenol hydroxylase-like FAD-dependent oxidoreductase